MSKWFTQQKELQLFQEIVWAGFHEIVAIAAMQSLGAILIVRVNPVKVLFITSNRFNPQLEQNPLHWNVHLPFKNSLKGS